MIYYLIKFLLTLNHKFTFKQVREINKKNMPLQGPLFVACNHVNAFIDPTMVGKYHKGSFWYVARGDVFKKKIAAWLLNKMHVLPIYRKQDDANNFIKNEGAMRNIVNKFILGERIVIYPEGICVQERRLRPLQKGTARMIFAAEEENNFSLNSKVICAGLNYNRPNQFGADIDVVYGHAFSIAEYKELYKADANKAIVALTQRMQTELKSLMIIINNKQDDELFNILEEMLVSEIVNKKKINKNKFEEIFKIKQDLAEKINTLSNTHPEKSIELRDLSKKYYTLLKKNKLRDWVVKKHNNFGLLQICISTLIFLVTLPLFLFGLLHHYFQYITAYTIAKKIVKKAEFFSSINYNIGMFLMLISYILFFLTALVVGGFSYYTFLYILLVPISGIFTHYFSIYIKKIKGELRFYFIKNKNVGKHIIETRNTLKAEAQKHLHYTIN